ncbi:hypothetical protein [Litoribrevibacter albus]|uniref:DUF3617 family protein n=1 Tax=Litoribrevibacter albus TaxID=1473156 RepID=A0AA37W8U6_9GAMM|nr:hypothetical protein [Litoribrevibacter albus]GLQ32399.1 hypothetical protein GCM10007876_28780 [Litoribrevibacter albus]
MVLNLKYIKTTIAAVIINVAAACHAGGGPTLDGLQGIYKYTFPNALMDNTQYTSENRFLLMQISPVTAYFETHLEWANGHSCDLSGIADVQQQALTYSTPSIMGKTCSFNINLGKDRLTFSDDNGACRLISCGARGLLDGIEFEYNSRNEISPDAIKKTPEFIRALSEYESNSN